MEVKSNRLACPSCDGVLLSTPDAGRFKCRGCGAEVILKGGKADAPVVDAVGRVQAVTDRVATEMALRRLQDELAALMYQRDQIAVQYHQQQASGGAGAVIVAGIVFLSCCLIGLFFLIAGSGSFFLVWIAAGVIIGIVTLTTLTNSNTRKSEALAKSLKGQLAPVDRAIYQTRKKIADSRAVVES